MHKNGGNNRVNLRVPSPNFNNYYLTASFVSFIPLSKIPSPLLSPTSERKDLQSETMAANAL